MVQVQERGGAAEKPGDWKGIKEGSTSETWEERVVRGCDAGCGGLQ